MNVDSIRCGIARFRRRCGENPSMLRAHWRRCCRRERATGARASWRAARVAWQCMLRFWQRAGSGRRRRQQFRRNKTQPPCYFRVFEGHQSLSLRLPLAHRLLGGRPGGLAVQAALLVAAGRQQEAAAAIQVPPCTPFQSPGRNQTSPEPPADILHLCFLRATHL